MEKKRKRQRIRQLEPIEPFADQGQQELHTRIVEIMQNPVWQRHFSDRQQNTTQLLPSKHLQLSPIHRHYQLARVQTGLPPLLLIKSLQIKQGYSINFVQDMGYWWGIMQENRPGFSRSVALPVLYTQPAYTEQMDRYIQHTVEALLRAPIEAQQQLIHVFTSNQAFKNAFVYMGREMGLVGGGFWSFVGSCFGTVVSSVVLGFGSGFISGFAKGGLVGGLIGGIFGGIVGCVMGATSCVKEYKARQKTRNELESIDQRIQKICEQADQHAKDEVQKISQNSKAYKQNRESILKQAATKL